MSKILVEILNTWEVQVFFIILGASLNEVWRVVKNKISENRKRRRIKAALIKQEEEVKLRNEVVTLQNGEPFFLHRSIIVRPLNKILTVGFPDQLRNQLAEAENDIPEQNKLQFSADCSFNGERNFSDLQRITGISNLCDMIDEHRIKVGDEFIRSVNGALFNGNKFGVYNIDERRYDKDEKQFCRIDVFKTDYFTHRVFRSIYKELRRKNHSIGQCTKNNMWQYRPFFTSFGINCILLTEGANSREIVFTRRSARVHSGGENNYHITMNEGLSQTDIDSNGLISLWMCLERGLKEEIGLSEVEFLESRHWAFYDVFLERTNFEIGISSMVELDINFDEHLRVAIAKDKPLETDDFCTVPLKAEEISSFMNKNSFVPHGRYCVKNILARENIVL